MNAGLLAPLIAAFAQSWAAHQPSLALVIVGTEVEVDPDHPLHGELLELCSGRSASLPFFPNASEVVWCTVAPDSDALRQAIASLRSWVLPSFGGQGKEGDGFVNPGPARVGLAARILAVSPGGYYRWRCERRKLPQVFEKLRLQRSLETARPERMRPPRPSLYELRARFASALLVGDRDGAEEIIGLLDSLQLETAVNTQFMRIRMWHYFGELDRIREHPDLKNLLAQPLPPRVRAWIDEALEVEAVPASATPPATLEIAASSPASVAPPEEPSPPSPVTWQEWFACIKKGENKNGADQFLQERPEDAAPDLSPVTIDALISGIDELSIDDPLRSRERNLILQGVAELLEEYVREPEFPRPALGAFYLALLRLWSALHAGTSIGREHGHVLLELASAALQLNLEPEEVRLALESWWRAKPAPSQLPFALDAIELLERELSDPAPVAGLWIEVADVIKRSSDSLPPGDRELWRRAGKRLGFEAATIAEYLPPEPPTAAGDDVLADADLKHVAIVCLREQQANQAAAVIHERTGAKVTVVAASSAGAETTQACTADVVLFVWMASTHAVFRAFDGYDRKRFCYVQGTGASSIVRSLERWAVI